MTTERSLREAAIEQAAVALISELRKLNVVDIEALIEKAKTGILGNEDYVWLASTNLKTEAMDAVEYLCTPRAPKAD